MTNAFDSSDSARSARPLRHAKAVVLPGPIRLETGGELPEVRVAYETWGRLNAERDNAILICHALSGDSHVARHDADDDPGWWDIAVGPGKAIDTDRYFVVCPNTLGGCRGTTGPSSLNPATGQPYGASFPVLTTADIVDTQRRLLETLGVERLLAVVGGSMGGHQVLTWATRLPERVRGAVALATSPRLTMQALAFNVVGRNAILRDPGFQGGQYYGSPGGGPAVGLALARMLGHITYLSAEAMTEKFEADKLQPRDVATEFEKRFSVGSYLAYQGSKFVERFDANSYVTLSLAMDLFNLGATPAELRAALERSRCRWLVASFSSDWLFPPEQSREIVDALAGLGKPVTYSNVASRCGHDAFLLEDDLATYGELMRGFLENLARPPVGDAAAGGDVYGLSPASIYHPHRLDYDRIVALVPPGASVLDLGCGQGALLSRLRARGHARLTGVELDEKAVVECARQGLDVVQADLNAGLGAFADGQFDVVVLSHTLQAIRDVERILDDMARVGRRLIVSFPNFAYYKLRRMLAEDGRAPESSGILRFKWHNTPNIRFFTIADFEDLCREKGLSIHQTVALDTEAGREVEGDANALADMAIFVVSK